MLIAIFRNCVSELISLSIQEDAGISYSTDPIFLFSPLAIHTRNLLADPRWTLVVQTPGWSGLSNARVTIFGDVYSLPEAQQEWAHKLYMEKHIQGPSQQWGNFYYFRMRNIRLALSARF